MKTFLLIFGPHFPTVKQMVEFINSRSEILNWIAPPLPSTLVITSLKSADELSIIIRNAFPTTFFMVSEIDKNKIDGWVPQLIWDHICAPKSSGRWNYTLPTLFKR